MNKELEEIISKFTFTAEEQESINNIVKEFAEEMWCQKTVRKYWIKKAKELEAENKRLHEELDKYKPTSQWYVCSECGRTTEDLACCLYDEDDGRGFREF